MLPADDVVHFMRKGCVIFVKPTILASAIGPAGDLKAKLRAGSHA